MRITILSTIVLSLLIITHSCSVKQVLDSNDKLPASAIAMQVLEQEPIIATDTGYFAIMASNPKGKFVKFSVEHSSNFQGFMDKTFIQIVSDVTVNSNGEFSRPVESVLINYPIKASTTAGEVLTVTFTFTDEAGGTVSVDASKVVVNYRTNASQEFLFVSRPFYNFYNGRAFAPSTLNNTTNFQDSLDVFWLRENNIQYLLSPNADRTAAYFANNASVQYDQSKMRTTKYIKLDGITLNDVNDNTFTAMDFSNGVEDIVLEHNAVYGVLLQDGRRAALETQIYLTQYSRVRSKYQIGN